MSIITARIDLTKPNMSREHRLSLPAQLPPCQIGKEADSGAKSPAMTKLTLQV